MKDWRLALNLYKMQKKFNTKDQKFKTSFTDSITNICCFG